MAVSNVPTTEKRTKQRTEATKQQSRARFGWLIILVLLSIVSGFFAGLLSHVYPSNWPFASLLYVAQSGSEGGAVMFVQPDDSDNTVNTLDIIERQQASTIVEVYPANTTEYTDETLLSYGMIVSADGWLAVPLQAVTNVSTVDVVLQDGRALESTVIVPDAYTNIAYISIPANQLPIADFTDTPIELGESTLLYRRSSEQGPTVKRAIVEDVMVTDRVISTDTFPYSIQLDARLDGPADSSRGYLGAAVFDATGSIVGMVTDVSKERVTPSAAIANPLYELFQKNTIVRHSLHITYDPLYQGIDTGSTRTGVRVVSASGIGEADIKLGDVIKRVNGKAVSQEDDLSQLLSEQLIDSIVDIELDRSAKDDSVSTIVTKLRIQ